MTVNGTTVTCDYCGGDCGNGGIGDCVVVSDLNFATGLAVLLHFCRVAKGGQPTCANRLLNDIVGIDPYPRAATEVEPSAQDQTSPSPAPAPSPPAPAPAPAPEHPTRPAHPMTAAPDTPWTTSGS